MSLQTIRFHTELCSLFREYTDFLPWNPNHSDLGVLGQVEKADLHTITTRDHLRPRVLNNAIRKPGGITSQRWGFVWSRLLRPTVANEDAPALSQPAPDRGPGQGGCRPGREEEGDGGSFQKGSGRSPAGRLFTLDPFQ